MLVSRIRTAAVLALVTVAVCGPAFPQPCMQTTAEWPFGVAQAIAVRNGRLYLGSGAGLIVYSVSGGSSPAELGRLPLPAIPIDIEVKGNLAVIAAGSAGILTVDVSDPSNLSLLGSTTVPGSAVELVLDGSRAWVAANGLQMVNLAERDAPEVNTVVPSQQQAVGIALSGATAFLAAGNGVRAYDVSDPSSPVSLGWMPTTGSSGDVVVMGDHAWVTDPEAWPHRLRGFDVSDPNAPAEIGSLDGLNGATEISVIGGMLYVSTNQGMWVVDVSEPTAPSEVNRIWWRQQPPLRAVEEDGVAFLLERADLEFSEPPTAVAIVDVTEPASPSEIDRLPTAGWTESLAVKGNRAILASREAGVHIVEVPQTGPPQLEGRLAELTPDVADERALGIAVQGDYAFVGACAAGMAVVDISNPTDPQLVATSDWQPGSQSCDGQVVIEGNLSFVVDPGHGVVVFDVANPSAPHAPGLIDVFHNLVGGVAAAGDHVFIVDSQVIPGLHVAQVSDPASPEIVGWAAISGAALDVALLGTHAYVASGYGGLRIFDISNPQLPNEVAMLNPPGHVYNAIATADGVAYVIDANPADGDSDVLRAIDVTEPTQPRELCSVELPYRPTGIVVREERVWLARGNVGFQVLRADPRTVLNDDFEAGNTSYWTTSRQAPDSSN